MRISTYDLIRNPHPDRVNSQDMPFSMIRFNNPADIDDDCILTFNQINARHMDETMRGSYEYAAVRVYVVRLKTE